MKEVLLFLGLAFVPVSGALVALWLKERARTQRAEEALYDLAAGNHPRSHQRAPANADMMAQLDAMAQDIERIAEAQRFTAKVLAERHERIGAPPLRNTTPH